MTTYQLAQMIVLAIVVERITELIVDSVLFEMILRGPLKRAIYPADRPPPDNFWQHCKVWFDKLISCGYCTSVWVAAVVAPALEFKCTQNFFMNWVYSLVLLHGLSNFYHVTYQLIKKGRIKTFDILIKEDHGVSGESAGAGAQYQGGQEGLSEVAQ